MYKTHCYFLEKLLYTYSINTNFYYMILTTTHTVPGKDITEIVGLVRGSSVRARHIGNDIMAGLKNIVGGEIEEYTKLQAHSREQAIERVIKEAEALGADAIVGIHMVTALITTGAAEILVYGTAVKLK
jgi:uncharacterized protein YbjQ (UPF0145 family)